jgi:predicted amidophosphoribosyltransferase
MYDKIPELSPQAVNLPKTNNSDPFTYAIEFTGLCHECKKQILEIAKEKALTVKNQENKLTIYSIIKYTNPLTTNQNTLKHQKNKSKKQDLSTNSFPELLRINQNISALIVNKNQSSQTTPRSGLS